MTDDANKVQEDFWTGEVGRQWLAHEAELDMMSVAARDGLLALADPQPGQQVLEIGCGGGGLAVELAQRVLPGGSVLALDIAGPMLSAARARGAAAGLTNLTFRQADAQTASLPEAAFDLALSHFGIMFFADPVAAFANIRRSLRPGGRLAFVCFGRADRNLWFNIPRAIAATRFGAGPEPAPGAPGPGAFADIARVTGLMQAAGFADCQGQARMIDYHHRGGAAAAAELASWIGPAAFILRQAGAELTARASVTAEIGAALVPYMAPDGLRLPVEVNLFSATAP